ncbi:hypothetical protein [Crystallibacter degradans]|uniref:hypothetical protein n=1 Tax=Crystallibacter degradans TaxID=2726743 RepID=UPI001474DD49|nr:hypothetical protein [Arthrobacter sp. SF27]NMR29193.1 hypothetical protein [Arthrobacter sp. SF27]
MTDFPAYNPAQNQNPPLRPEAPAPFMANMQKTVKAKKAKTFNADAYRAAVWLVVAVLAIIVWFAAPQGGSAADWSSSISAAETNKIINDGSTEGAPQQQVVNGWFVADTIPVLSEQTAALHTSLNSGRIPSLMLLFVLGFCADVAGRSIAAARTGRTAEGRATQPRSFEAEAAVPPAPAV